MEQSGSIGEPPEVPDHPAIKPNTDLDKLLIFKVYKRRWFILIVFCLLNCSNSMLWLTFAPVADQSAEFLGASLDQINWLSLVYMVVAIPLSFGTTWILDTLGLRFALVLGSWLNMLGAVMRYAGVQDYGVGKEAYFPVVMAGQTLCALAQTLVIFSPTKLAALWFPEHQRATANMIASMSNPLGLLFANILSPLLLGTIDFSLLLFVYAAPAVLVCLLATAGIRSSVPPTPPSPSAETANAEPFLQGITLLLKNKAYLILLLCFGGGIAVFTCFSTLLEQILCVRGYSTDFCGLCGALFIVFGVVGAAFLGLYIDKTKQFIEATKINMSFMALAAIAFAVVSQMREQKVAVASTCAAFGFFGFSIYPVAMELSVECSYPVGEATSAGLIFISGQIQSVIYIVLLQALTKRLADSPFSTCSTGGDSALSWRVSVLVMAGLWSASSCFFVIFFHTKYRRLEAEAQASRGKDPGSSPKTEDNNISVIYKDGGVTG